MTERKAILTIDGEDTPIVLNVYPATLGQDVIDVSPVLGRGYFTFDQGFASTASTESKITYIDGDKGILMHRGYPIEELAEKSDYLETCFLILNGELPNAKEKVDFQNIIRTHTMLNRSVESFFSGFRYDAHPMAILCGAVGAMSSFYHDSLDINDPHHRMITAHRLIAKMPTLAAMCHKHFIGQPYMYPDNSLGYSENFLHMMFGNPCEEKEINPVVAKAVDKLFLLHADHEQNASTSTVRLAGSSGANPFSCVAAGIAALWGPAHGGANQAVLEMLKQIGDVKHIDNFVKRAKDKDDPFRLMGFGHRVYKNFDPRAVVMKKTCDAVLGELGLFDDPLLKIAKRLETIALEDEYFVEKKLYPNVDFYSGIIMKAIGIPTEMFTAIFATGRTVGWISHWNEMISNPYRIGRPRQLYTGPLKREYVPVDQRG